MTLEAEFGVMQPQAKECSQQPAAGRGRDTEHPLEHPERMGVSLIRCKLDS